MRVDVCANMMLTFTDRVYDLFFIIFFCFLLIKDKGVVYG